MQRNLWRRTYFALLSFAFGGAAFALASTADSGLFCHGSVRWGLVVTLTVIFAMGSFFSIINAACTDEPDKSEKPAPDKPVV